jgi:hypothetical protein
MVNETNGPNAAPVQEGRESQRRLVDVDRSFQHDLRKALPASTMHRSFESASLKLVHGGVRGNDARKMLGARLTAAGSRFRASQTRTRSRACMST